VHVEELHHLLLAALASCVQVVVVLMVVDIPRVSGKVTTAGGGNQTTGG